jgi:hypothetical protein
MNDQELREMIRESIARHTGVAIGPRRPSRVRRCIQVTCGSRFSAAETTTARV